MHCSHCSLNSKETILVRCLKPGGFIGPNRSHYSRLSSGLLHFLFILFLVLHHKVPGRLHHLRSLLLGLVQDLLGIFHHSLRSTFYLVFGSVEGTFRSGKEREDKDENDKDIVFANDDDDDEDNDYDDGDDDDSLPLAVNNSLKQLRRRRRPPGRASTVWI